MSDEKHETVADVVREMRNGRIPQHRHDDELLRKFADRIEAADHRFREVAKMIPHEEVAAAKTETTTPTSEKSSAVGSVEKCRRANYKPMTLDEAIAHAEAVVDETPCGQAHRQLAEWLIELREIKNSNAAAMLGAVDKLLNFLRWEYAQDYPVTRDKLADAIDIGVSALSTPPRNCDVGTVDAQVNRYNKFCMQRACSECPFYVASDLLACGVRWAQMTYEESK